MRIDPAYQRRERLFRILLAVGILAIVLGITWWLYSTVTSAGSCQATYIKSSDKNGSSRQESCS